ncbi:Nadh:flavin oxidoreductase nadh oxidase [Mycena kentingensis (nom. inval.)]|nr:Nadh:flavin oxidoreductase nadh oxidase [Mycena kentingensis (nom. inval.)]
MSSPLAPPALFQPLRVGDIELQHRVVLTACTRFRVDDKHVPLPHVAEYYEQRASTPGTLLVTEAVLISPAAGGYPNVPGIWSDEQVAAWKTVTDRVHAKGSFIYMQLWALGRTANPDYLAADGLPFVSASDVPMGPEVLPYVPNTAPAKPSEAPSPRPLTVAEIKGYVAAYATAAHNAVHRAGFDGVEIHGANGYLPNQFLHEGSNVRTDEYGGDIEKRARFTLEVVDAVAAAVGDRKTAIRLSPWGDFQSMFTPDPIPMYTHLVTAMRDNHPSLAYISVIEPHSIRVGSDAIAHKNKSNDFIRAIWGNRVLMSGGGYTRETAIAVAEAKGDVVGFGRQFIANPDLPYRLLHNLPLNKHERAYFYGKGDTNPKGYTDYPFAARM